MDIVTIIPLVISGVALIVAGLAWFESRRSANAAEHSAEEAERANEIALLNYLQSWGEKVVAEIEKEKLLGNTAKVDSLEFMFTKVHLDTFRKFATTNEEGKRIFVEIFSGIADRMPNDKEAIHELIAYVLREE